MLVTYKLQTCSADVL